MVDSAAPPPNSHFHFNLREDLAEGSFSERARTHNLAQQSLSVPASLPTARCGGAPTKHKDQLPSQYLWCFSMLLCLGKDEEAIRVLLTGDLNESTSLAEGLVLLSSGTSRDG